MSKLKYLPPPDHQHLEAAGGWIGLRNYLDADEELEKVRPGLIAHPFVLELRCKIYEPTGRWEMAVEVAIPTGS